jgi:hypothetical protein
MNLEPTSRSASWPRLSERLQPFRSRKVCQKCGAAAGKVATQGEFKASQQAERLGHRSLKFGNVTTVYGWQEHDHNDVPEHIYLFLCTKCSDELIEPHVRLYRQIQQHAPSPGIMDLCVDCKWREGSRCKCPIAVFNGGPKPGMQIDYAEPPSIAFVDGTRKGKRWGGRIALYNTPPTACSGKAVQ